MDPIIDLFPPSPLSREFEGEVSGEETEPYTNTIETEPYTNTNPVKMEIESETPHTVGRGRGIAKYELAFLTEPVVGKNTVGRGRGLAKYKPAPLIEPVVGRDAGKGALLPGSSHSPFRNPIQHEEAKKGTKRPSTFGGDQRSKKHRSVCPIVGCGHASPKLRWHVYYHLPNFFRPQEEHTGPGWSKTLSKRAKALHMVANFLTGVDNIEGLIDYTNKNWHSVESPLSETDKVEMGLLQEKEGWEQVVPTLQPINSPGYPCALAALGVPVGQTLS
ncbi:uncharacterized protein LOC121431018 [Lytechinus variegatus]|uniref:uncharacterized protein LOC121431018 n=1 Tax=Lytechinus variegatus TaxID=7654 RepID=UPI001BB24CBC|nr:uncharacterized protein LOC121431018 [Lytechinus variegatus]